MTHQPRRYTLQLPRPGPVALQEPAHWSYDFDPVSKALRASSAAGGNTQRTLAAHFSDLVTAAGGNTQRTLAAHFGDVANVLDYGADPTGRTDCSAAFNTAASQMGLGGRNKAVYIPAGAYLINNQISLANGQAMYGDSRGTSVPNSRPHPLTYQLKQAFIA